jgi:hypothetical protein
VSIIKFTHNIWIAFSGLSWKQTIEIGESRLMIPYREESEWKGNIQ